MLRAVLRSRTFLVSVLLFANAFAATACAGNDSSAEAEGTFRDASEELVTVNDTIQEAASTAADPEVARRTLNRYVPTIATLARRLESLAPKITGKRHDAAQRQATAAVALAAAYSRFQAGLDGDNASELALASAAIGEAADEIAAATDAWNAAGAG